MTTTELTSPTAERPAGRLRRAMLLVRRNPATTIAVVFLLLVVFVAFFPNLAAPFDPLEAHPLSTFQSPGWPYLLGTDNIGRDLLSRIIHGASASMPAALLATALALVIGSCLGVVAAVFGGWVDAVIMRVFDAVLAIPGLLIIFAFLAVMGNGVIPIAVAIGIGSSTSFGRLMRAEVYRIRAMTFVEAARAAGVSAPRVVFRHIVPNALRPVVALAALDIGAALLAIGAIGYLGFGTQPPAPEWGAMIAEGQRYLTDAWWLSVVPRVTFVVIVLSANQISRHFERISAR